MITRIKNMIFTALFLVPLFGMSQEIPKENLVKQGSLMVPTGFDSEVVIADLGKARHLVVTPEGNLYVKLAKAEDGKGTLFIQQKNGKAEVTKGFGDYGGTGIHLSDQYLYTSSNEDVYRYKLNASHEVIDPDSPERIVKGLIDRGQHNGKSLALDKTGNIYVNIGAYSNSCQIKDRQKGSLGMPNCPILDSAGGIWKFRADKLEQGYGDGQRFATGLRNVVGLDWNNKTNELFVMQHGRDQLNGLFPDLYTEKLSSELPAECMYVLKQGDNAGWPFIYYDGFQKKKIVAPEYGGDTKKEIKYKYIDPVAVYSAHLGPNALLFYTGDQFPAKYKNGAFIAFHGSWNRAPEPQAGYFVAFQPFKDGRPTGEWEIFADGFSGSPENTAKGRADHRPCGLAQGPDGSLYIADDVKGSIYKISYNK